MKIPITIELLKKRAHYVAKCPELDFISQGKTSDEARKNLLEVLEIQFEEMEESGALEEYLAECGYEKHGDSYQFSGERLEPEICVYEVA